MPEASPVARTTLYPAVDGWMHVDDSDKLKQTQNHFKFILINNSVVKRLNSRNLRP